LQRLHAKFYSRSHDAVIRVYDQAGNVIETHEHTGDDFPILQVVNGVSLLDKRQ